jgi:hypothetical protein
MFVEMRRIGRGRKDDQDARDLCGAGRRLRTTWCASVVDGQMRWMAAAMYMIFDALDCAENSTMSVLMVVVNESASVRWATSASWRLYVSCHCGKYSKSQGDRRGVERWVAPESQRPFWEYTEWS